MTNRDLKHEEVINNILENKMNGLVYLPTGYGKTRIVLKALERSSFKNVLWVCGSEEFRDNGLWEECNKWGIQKSVCKSAINLYPKLKPADTVLLYWMKFNI